MYKKYALIFFIIILKTQLYAEVDKEMIRKYNTWLGIKLYTTSNGLNYSIKDFHNRDINKNFKAKFPLAFGTQVTIANFSIAHTFEKTQQLLNSNLSLKNLSNYWSLDLNYFGDRFVIENSVQSYKKFSVKNKCNCNLDLVQASINTTKEYLDAAINSLQFNSSIQYVFNYKKWSYAALKNQNARQLKSAGSLLLMFAFDYQQIKSTQDYLVNQTLSFSSFDNYNLLQQINASTPLINIGYGYILVKKRLFLGGIAYVGPGWLFSNIKQINIGNIKNQQLNFKGKLTLTSGYNGRVFFAGLQTSVVNINSSIKEEFKTNWLNYEYSAYFGLRLATKKIKQ